MITDVQNLCKIIDRGNPPVLARLNINYIFITVLGDSGLSKDEI